MKKHTYIILTVIAVVSTSCTLFDLEFQESTEYKKSVINSQTNLSVIDFMKSRRDLFSSMLEAIQYVNLDTLYNKEGNTYLLLTNYALSNLENGESYFRKNTLTNLEYNPADPLSSSTVFGSTWENYPKERVAEFLKYHVAKGTYNYNQLTAKRIWADTYAKGDTTKLSLVLTNDIFSNILIQNNLGYNSSTKVWSFNSISPRTSGIECLNSGAVHVMDRYINPPSAIQLGLIRK